METSLSSEPPVAFVLSIINTSFTTADLPTVLICSALIILLILCSAIISSSENALFSLNQLQLDELSNTESRSATNAKFLLQHPKHLLATILISNTFVNIAIVVLSTVIIGITFNFHQNAFAGFLVEVVFVTFILVLFGEVMPKIYASQNNLSVALFVAIPMYTLNKLLKPFVFILVKSTSIIDKRITKKGHVLSVDELTHAIDITNEEETPHDEKAILKSIVNFGNTSVKQIMRQRPDVVALEANTTFKTLLHHISDWGYSRVPVYEENLDNIIGVLYIKDLLPHLKSNNEFNWHTLIRKPYFVPESKKIDDLLRDFQSKRVHLAIVVDEFGGTQGMVTMEDILEEIFGEINDEFDEDEVFYSKLNETTFVFEAKISINDMVKLMEVEYDVFNELRNEAETLGGMLLELEGELPANGKEILYKQFKFTIEAVDKRKIKRVKVELLNAANE